MRILRSISVNKNLDNYFRVFIEQKYGSLWGNYSREVENAMLVEMAWWRYTPFDEIGFLRRTEQRSRSAFSRVFRGKQVLRVIKIDPVLDATFKSFVLLSSGRVWGSYSSSIESGMALLMLLSRFKPFEEVVKSAGSTSLRHRVGQL
ncbi:MAG: hypothetical protein QXH56_02375 [Thermoprotei archaeon]